MLYFSRVSLKKEASLSALAPLLLGSDGVDSESRQPAHHLVWYLFADGPGRQRDFLWRETNPGVFLLLSFRPPRDPHGLFDIAEPKPFAPELKTGDPLIFSLRANPVVRRRDNVRGRSVKHDVVMDQLRAYAQGKRARHRLDLVRTSGLDWLKRQGDKAGFDFQIDDVSVDGYSTHRIARKNGPAMAFSTLDFEGALTVTDPKQLLTALPKGFGASKAYGCGLMLIRRA